jgi:16S rRNA G966 N2-methylase RsmD
MVVDLFAGSGSTLSWIKRRTGARRAVGFERGDVVFELASRNLRIAGLDIDLRHGSYQHGLQALGRPGADLLIVFVSPPWGHALSEGSGLDLRRTQPPVAEAVDLTTAAIGRHKLLFAI